MSPEYQIAIYHIRRSLSTKPPTQVPNEGTKNYKKIGVCEETKSDKVVLF